MHEDAVERERLHVCKATPVQVFQVLVVQILGRHGDHRGFVELQLLDAVLSRPDRGLEFAEVGEERGQQIDDPRLDVDAHLDRVHASHVTRRNLVHDDGDVAGVLLEPIAEHVALVVRVVQRRDVLREIRDVDHLFVERVDVESPARDVCQVPHQEMPGEIAVEALCGFDHLVRIRPHGNHREAFSEEDQIVIFRVGHPRRRLEGVP
mmetsp:Transcript_66090/g.157714  ORF Transcript_66090/g.157714 Transcript_66090/m.157714 type:complete len:207 (-) Transcript_66090:422-1042(-)